MIHSLIKLVFHALIWQALISCVFAAVSKSTEAFMEDSGCETLSKLQYSIYPDARQDQRHAFGC